VQHLTAHKVLKPQLHLLNIIYQ